MSDLQNNPSTPERSNVKRMIAGNACILIATIFWGINVPVSKELIPTALTSVDITTWRLLGGTIAFWVVSLFMKRQAIAKADWWRVVVGGALGLFSFIFLFNESLRYGDPIDISIIMTVPPIFVILIGVIFQHRHASWLELAGAALGFVGAAMVILTEHGGKAGSDDLLGDLLALASALCYAIYLVVLEGPTHRYRPIPLLRWVFLCACLPLLIVGWHFPEAGLFHGAGSKMWICALFVLICPSIFSYFLVNPAVKMIGSELTSMYQYTLPVFATISAVIMGLSHLYFIQVVAMVIIIAGMLLTNYAKHRNQ